MELLAHWKWAHGLTILTQFAFLVASIAAFVSIGTGFGQVTILWGSSAVVSAPRSATIYTVSTPQPERAHSRALTDMIIPHSRPSAWSRAQPFSRSSGKPTVTSRRATSHPRPTRAPAPSLLSPSSSTLPSPPRTLGSPSASVSRRKPIKTHSAERERVRQARCRDPWPSRPLQCECLSWSARREIRPDS